MVGSFASLIGRPSSGSWIDAWLQRRRRHPDAFSCGVRVVEGTVPGVGRRWRYRDSAVDPHAPEGAIALNHGSGVTLRLRFADPVEPVGISTRPDHLVVPAVDIPTGARVQLSVPRGELATFGIDV
jgi:hypothetical protein